MPASKSARRQQISQPQRKAKCDDLYTEDFLRKGRLRVVAELAFAAFGRDPTATAEFLDNPNPDLGTKVPRQMAEEGYESFNEVVCLLYKVGKTRH